MPWQDVLEAEFDNAPIEIKLSQRTVRIKAELASLEYTTAANNQLPANKF